MQQIPLPTSNAYFVMKCNIEDKTTSFRFLWNEQDGHFHCDIENVDGTAYGVRMVAGSRLLASRGASSPFSEGDLVMLPLVLLDRPDLAFDTFGEAWGLFYATDEELDALQENGWC